MKKSSYACAISFLLIFAASPAAGRGEDISRCIDGLDARNSGQYVKAIALFNSCIETGSLGQDALVSTYRNIGIAYRMNKQPSKAVVMADKAIALHPFDVEKDYVNRGNAFDDQGKSQEAFADYSQALRLRPDNVQALYNRGVAYEHRKEFAKAQSDFIAAYNNGLRSALLHERLVMYRLIKPGSPDEWTPMPSSTSESDAR